MCDRFYEQHPQKCPLSVGLKADYNDPGIFVNINFTIVGDNGTQAALKNFAPFICSKIDGTTIDYAKDLDLTMTM